MQSPDKAARPETRVTVQPPTQMDFPGPELRVTQLCLASISMQKSWFCSLSGLQPVLEVFPLLTFIATIGTISHRKASRHDLFGNLFWNPSQQTKALSFAYQASAHGSLFPIFVPHSSWSQNEELTCIGKLWHSEDQVETKTCNTTITRICPIPLSFSPKEK